MAQGTPSWLNQDFAQEILRNHEGDNSIEVTDMFTKSATSKGDNYASDMFRIYLEVARNRGGKKVTEKRSLIMKVAPTVEGPRKDLIEKANIFMTEINMMTNTLKRMNEQFNNEHRFNATCLYVQQEIPQYLILEDLAPLGYRMADRQAGLDLKHCTVAIQNIARFHASSVAVCEKDPLHKELYRKGIFSDDNPAELATFFVEGAKALADQVEQWPELGKTYADKIRGQSSYLYNVGIESMRRKDDEFNVINHGDFWVNNMLFRYNDDGEPIDHIFVDFQMAIYTTPAIDLHYFLNTSPSPHVYATSRQFLLDEYLRTLTATMKQLGCKTQPPTMRQLQKYLADRIAFAMIASFTVLPIVLTEKSEVKEIDEILGVDGQYENPAYKGEQYRKIMVKRIPEFEKAGLLDH